MAFKIPKYLKSIWRFTFRVNQFDNDFALPVPAIGLWISGLWPYSFTWLFCVLCISSTFFTLFGEFGAVIFFWPDISAECYAGSTIITGSRSVFISLLIGHRVNKFIAMLNMFIEKIWVSEKENKHAHMIIEKEMKLSNWSNLVMQYLLVIYLITPLMHLNNEGNKFFPYLLVYPFDMQNPLTYSLIYVNCIFAGFVGVGCVTGHDILMNFILLHTCMRLRMLSSRIETLGDKSFEKNMERETYIAEELKSVSEAHCELISFANTMEELFSPHILMHFFSTSILACILGVQLLLVELTIVERVKNALYFMVCLGQIFANCTSGQMLINNSSRIAEAVYTFKWQDVSIKYRANILLMMQRAQRPLKLTAGKFFDLSMETFGSTLKAAASYFTLLKNLLDKRN